MNDAFVLAAGFGTRLRPLTNFRPKPLVPVCGVPLLAYSLALCRVHGFRNVIVNAHWLADQLLPWQGEHEGVNVEVAVEQPEILGTGGGLRAVRDRLAPRFVVLNGDVLHDVNLRALADAVVPGGAAMALRPDPERAPGYGIVAADASGRVVRLTSLATATPQGFVDETTHFTGIHALDRVVLDRVPDGFACIVRSAYVHLVPEHAVGAIRYEGAWLDAGNPTDYLETNLAVLRGEVHTALDPHVRARFANDGRRVVGRDAGCATEGAVWIGQGAALGQGVHLRDSVVGEGATVPEGTTLDQVVVWDGCTVPAGHWRRAVVHPGGVCTDL